MENISEKLILLPLFYRKLNAEAVAASGLGSSQLQILVLLNRMGKLPMYEIADRICISKPNLTPLIDKLCKAGYVDRTPGELDRRVIFVSITGKGMSCIYGYKQAMTNLLSYQLNKMPIQEQQKLDEAFETIVSAFRSLNE
jgi:DNA-binding MarR family transcriptional regulator